MTIKFKSFETRESAALDLANNIEALLSKATEGAAAANFMVSGGSSPLQVYRQLNQASLDWSQVNVILSDERCVAADDDQSNAKMVAQQLLQNNAAAAKFFPLVTDEGEPLDASETAALQDTFEMGFDVSLLGMGEDGHTASLFPDAAELEEAILGKAFSYALVPDHLKQKRVSLSARVLLNSKHTKLLIFGERKKQLFELACQPGDVIDLPIRVILQQTDVPVTVYWAP